MDQISESQALADAAQLAKQYPVAISPEARWFDATAPDFPGLTGRGATEAEAYSSLYHLLTMTLRRLILNRLEIPPLPA